MERYQLRYAAGIYWLLDMAQEGLPYKKPIPFNEQAAMIWKMIAEGMTLKEIANRLSQLYQISIEETKSDVQEFLEQLRKQGVVL